MAQRRHHYEQAFEAYLRTSRMPYVAVNEARKALLPAGARFRLEPTDPSQGEQAQSLKSFDFVVYGDGTNLLVEVKGRRMPSRSASARARRPGLNRLESWVNSEDVRSLQAWQPLFGPEFRAVFVFLYWCEDLPADGLFEEVIEHRNRWYALRVVDVDAYARVMRVRSQRWGTVHVDAASFAKISHPFSSDCLKAGPYRPQTRGISGCCTGYAPRSTSGLHADVGLAVPAMEPLGHAQRTEDVNGREA